MRQKIVDEAERLFFHYGVRSVSMDDIARELSTSKKTLYQFFKSKDELVLEMTRQRLYREMDVYKKIPEVSKNAIEELRMLSGCIRQTATNMNPSSLYDIQKYYPQAWASVVKFKQEFIRGMVFENIKRGKADGYYRDSVSEAILSILRVEIIQIVFDQRAFPPSEFSYLDVQMQLFDHFVHGLLSDKGKDLYNQFLQAESNPLEL